MHTEKIDYHDVKSKKILNYVFIYFVYVRQCFLLIFHYLKLKELDGIIDALWIQKVEYKKEEVKENLASSMKNLAISK